MKKAKILVLAAMLLVGGPGMSAQNATNANPASNSALVRGRYIVQGVPASGGFFTKLGFKLDAQSGPFFAALSRGGVQLLLSPTTGPGGASQAMPNGDKPAPGGWNRMVLDTSDLKADVDRLRKEGVHFRNDIVVGLG